MDVDRIKHIMSSLLILTLLIFGALSAIILITDVPFTNTSLSLPFAFLYVSLATFVVMAQIDERPKLIQKYLRDWLIICLVGILISALAFTFY
jgi:drug/metabolite transporter (DMT)-like permease